MKDFEKFSDGDFGRKKQRKQDNLIYHRSLRILPLIHPIYHLLTYHHSH